VGVYQAVGETQLRSPVLVGHSYSAIVAIAYASRHPARGVINVDQWLQVKPFAELVQCNPEPDHAPRLWGAACDTSAWRPARAS
jgi:pimeloyl-ACP methyl ester carboxylesterase